MSPQGFEPRTLRLRVSCSTRLSYGPKRRNTWGIEPLQSFRNRTGQSRRTCATHRIPPESREGFEPIVCGVRTRRNNRCATGPEDVLLQRPTRTEQTIPLGLELGFAFAQEHEEEGVAPPAGAVKWEHPAVPGAGALLPVAPDEVAGSHAHEISLLEGEAGPPVLPLRAHDVVGAVLVVEP